MSIATCAENSWITLKCGTAQRFDGMSFMTETSR